MKQKRLRDAITEKKIEKKREKKYRRRGEKSREEKGKKNFSECVVFTKNLIRIIISVQKSGKASKIKTEIIASVIMIPSAENMKIVLALN